MPSAAAAQGAQQASQGIQQAAGAAAQQAGDNAVQQAVQQTGTQAGQTPEELAATNKHMAAQPRPAKVTPQARARGAISDNNQNRNFGLGGKPVPTAESEAEPELPANAEKTLSNPDEGENYNDKADADGSKRAKERAKEIDKGATGTADSMGKDGAGRPQGHHEVTNPDQFVATKLREGVLNDEERTSLMNAIFGG
jgi:hypothetical protein